MEKMKKVYRNGVDKKVSVKLTPSQIDRMDQIMEEHGNNVSEILRQALNSYLDKIEAERKKEPARNLFNYHEDIPW